MKLLTCALIWKGRVNKSFPTHFLKKDQNYQWDYRKNHIFIKWKMLFWDSTYIGLKLCKLLFPSLFGGGWAAGVVAINHFTRSLTRGSAMFCLRAPLNLGFSKFQKWYFKVKNFLNFYMGTYKCVCIPAKFSNVVV
jgi:hypothetical protein